MSQKSLITVITITRNDLDGLRLTCDSVESQSFGSYEHIIIDGCSSDGTLNFLNNLISTKVIWESEADRGIYHALNKGAKLASGSWIIFMNSGDVFKSSTVLEKCSQHFYRSHSDIIFGDHEVIYPNGEKIIRKAGSISKIWKGMPFCHQSTFVKRELVRDNPFSEIFEIASDFKFFYDAYLEKKEFQYIPEVISIYKAGGVSDIKRVQAIRERWRVINKSPKRRIYYFFLLLAEFIKKPLKVLF